MIDLKSLGMLGIRLCAVWLMVTSIRVLLAFPATIASLRDFSDQGPPLSLTLFSMVAEVFPILVAIALWIKAEPLAERLVRGLPQPAENQPPQVSGGELELAVIGGIGLFLLVTALPYLAYNAWMLWQIDLTPSAPHLVGQREQVTRSAISHLVQSILGAWLLLRNQSIANLTRRMRVQNN